MPVAENILMTTLMNTPKYMLTAHMSNGAILNDRERFIDSTCIQLYGFYSLRSS